jgi:hypothetical protein
MRNKPETTGQRPVNCYCVKMGWLWEEPFERLDSRNGVDAGLLEGKCSIVHSPLQEAETGRFFVSREPDIDSEGCAMIIHVGSSSKSCITTRLSRAL